MNVLGTLSKLLEQNPGKYDVHQCAEMLGSNTKTIYTYVKRLKERGESAVLAKTVKKVKEPIIPEKMQFKDEKLEAMIEDMFERFQNEAEIDTKIKISKIIIDLIKEYR